MEEEQYETEVLHRRNYERKQEYEIAQYELMDDEWYIISDVDYINSVVVFAKEIG